MANEDTTVKPEDQKLVEMVSVKTDKVEDDCSDIFVTEKDTFDVTVEYYKKDDVLYVEGDDGFDKEVASKKITMSFKYVNQGDIGLIALQAANSKMSTDGQINARDFVALEFHRFNVLIRKWSIKKEINNENILGINAKIIKAFLSKIRDKIGMDGML